MREYLIQRPLRMKVVLPIVLAIALHSTHALGALLGRAPATAGGDDYQAYYDDVLNMTWMADPHLAAREKFGIHVGYGGMLTADGLMDWATANLWLERMNAVNYLGVSDWRLPATHAIECGRSSGPLVGDEDIASVDGGANCGVNVPISSSEMAHLYYATLGNIAVYDTSGALTGCTSYTSDPNGCLANGGPFTFYRDAEPIGKTNVFWSTEYLPSQHGEISDSAWYFSFDRGVQNIDWEIFGGRVWAVHSGDIALVPAPQALWLLTGAISLLIPLRRGPRTKWKKMWRQEPASA